MEGNSGLFSFFPCEKINDAQWLPCADISNLKESNENCVFMSRKFGFGRKMKGTVYPKELRIGLLFWKKCWACLNVSLRVFLSICISCLVNRGGRALLALKLK